MNILDTGDTPEITHPLTLSDRSPDDPCIMFFIFLLVEIFRFFEISQFFDFSDCTDFVSRDLELLSVNEWSQECHECPELSQGD